MKWNQKILTILLYPLPAFLTHFPRTFNANNWRNPPTCPLLVIVFINEEATGSINEEAIGVINEAATERKNPLSCFFVSCFTVSVAPLSNHVLLFQYHHQ